LRTLNNVKGICKKTINIVFERKKQFTFAEIINPKNHKMAYVINDDCTACGTCIDECPVEAIAEGDIYVIDPDECTDCGACADVCPVEAIHPV
jgi:NAD-dependent dihydropyrimidine dehydrogenase PreA subunit